MGARQQTSAEMETAHAFSTTMLDRIQPGIFAPAPSTPASLWEPEEDQLLIMAISQFRDQRGRPAWRLIAEAIPNRTVAMCRNRYARMMAPEKTQQNSEKNRAPNMKCEVPRENQQALLDAVQGRCWE